MLRSIDEREWNTRIPQRHSRADDRIPVAKTEFPVARACETIVAKRAADYCCCDAVFCRNDLYDSRVYVLNSPDMHRSASQRFSILKTNAVPWKSQNGFHEFPRRKRRTRNDSVTRRIKLHTVHNTFCRNVYMYNGHGETKKSNTYIRLLTLQIPTDVFEDPLRHLCKVSIVFSFKARDGVWKEVESKTYNTRRRGRSVRMTK